MQLSSWMWRYNIIELTLLVCVFVHIYRILSLMVFMMDRIRLRSLECHNVNAHPCPWVYFLVFSICACWRLCGSWSARYHHHFVMRKHSADNVCLPWEKNRVDFVTCIAAIMRKVCKNCFCTLYVCVYDEILVSFGGSSSSSWIIYESHALFNISMSPR